MKSGILVYALALLLSFISTTLHAESSVWKIKKGNNYLFLGGTVHVLAAADYPLPDEFDQAYQRSERLVLETDMQKLESPDFQQTMLRELTYSDGRNLKSVLSEKTFQALEQYCSSRGIPMANLLPFKPGLVAATLTIFELQYLGLAGEGVDAYFNGKAVKDQKSIGQLETVEAQLEFISTMGQGREDEMIAYTLSDIKNLSSLMGEIKQLWRSGNMSDLDTLAVIPFKNDFPGIYKKILVDRNNAWIPQIQSMLKTREVEFVLVGALHLAGEDGLLAQLSASGYEVQKF